MPRLVMTKLQSEIQNVQFNCGNQSINSLIPESYCSTILQHAHAYSLSINDITVGYYMINFERIQIDRCPEEISDYYTNLFKYCYSVNIKYIAIDSKYQNKGIGNNTLKHIIISVYKSCKYLPIRLITLEALRDKYLWYSAVGFKAMNKADIDTDSPTIFMYIDCLTNINSVHNYIEESI